MKKIINDPQKVVEEMLEGIQAANPDVCYIENMGVIARRTKTGRVGVVSGGGSGHEPMHAGYVGEGMLDAAVSGNVFASPDPERILAGIKAADSGKGVLLIITNYSGDCMNFSMAAELANMEGISTASVIVRDDVSVKDSMTSTGRRGIAGTILVHKVAGAAAAAGYSLEEVRRLAQKAADNVRTMGMAMSSCTIPAIGRPGFELADDEVELGMGIHGEPGVKRVKLMSAKETARVLLSRVLNDLKETGSEFALMVNGLGGTPLMELYILNREAHIFLKGMGVKIHETFVGNYITSLEMAGCSLTLMRLDEEMKPLLEAPCDTMAWKRRA
ncbi:dihydroxyacetone kinase subunit DhaK [[Clostridium] hylemonae]|uniref:dihydroxyacetone kinase subunit DhaK n=1 Tax=[Clostridium] hylemonae TaxID=89153 RepID=UPI001FCC2A28|nr:dihydroxyacetone kinase subunit DhaK [[Clostridium] hylemonae]BDF05922.1 dihydroxyacetone kinase subunit DhaK [[Clostridium] hylemonae]